MKQYLDSEIWTQDPEDRDLWHGKHGVIVNTAALNEREFYVNVIRVPYLLEGSRHQAHSRLAA